MSYSSCLTCGSGDGYEAQKTCPRSDCSERPKKVVIQKTDRLHHRLCETAAEFFQKIDERGGWPLDSDRDWVGFEHTSERRAGFTDKPYRTGKWTTLYHRDDYLWWKMSDARKKKIAEDVRREFAREIERIA